MLSGPTFICIGAQKAGTTWLFKMLSAHPGVFVPPAKELHFFDQRRNLARGLEWYRQQFAPGLARRARGELTTNYLWVTYYDGEAERHDRVADIPGKLRESFPDIRLIVILRNPVERAISGYYHHIGARRVAPTSSILKVMDQWGIGSMGFYDEHLRQWFNVFPRDRFLILLYEADVSARPAETLRRVFRFIDVDEGFEPADIAQRHNATGNHLYMRINYYLPKVGGIVENHPSLLMGRDWRIEVTAEERETLAELYAPHNRRLEELLGTRTGW
jgi:hypothetical protein